MKMKNILLLFVSAFCLTPIAFGQNADAKKILDAVSNKYDAYKSIQSEFSFQIKQADGEDYTDKGKLFLNRAANQYKIVLETQDLISDGESVWSVLKQDKEVQVSPADPEAQAIGPNNIFTFYRSGYRLISAANESVPSVGALQAVELTPEDEQSNYSKIKIRINKNQHIHDVMVWDKSGAQYIYTIQALYVNHSIPASTFRFQKASYPGFEIVDLR